MSVYEWINKPNWRYLYNSKRAKLMLVVLLLNIIGTIMVIGSYEDYYIEQPKLGTEIVDKTTNIKTPVTGPSVKNGETATEDTSYTKEPTATSTVKGPRQFRMHDGFFNGTVFIPDPKELYSERHYWILFVLFYSYNLAVIVSHVFVKVFIESSIDVYARMSSATIVINFIILLWSVNSTKRDYILAIYFIGCFLSLLCLSLKMGMSSCLSERADETPHSFVVGFNRVSPEIEEEPFNDDATVRQLSRRPSVADNNEESENDQLHVDVGDVASQGYI